MKGTLLLVRHGESEWNALGKWTGLTDVSLSPQGHSEAKKAAIAISSYTIDQAFCSVLARAKQTLADILEALHIEGVPTIYHPALNERDYGDYTGKNKWDVEKEVGEEAFKAIRRGYETPIPNGENLHQVCDRVHPYYTENILPILKQGKTVLITAHGNSLRALIKLLDQVPDDRAHEIELKTGEVVAYEITETGTVASKKMLATNTEVGLQ
jgi:2,3-bisphosphoglycerate-dependent phosphoglycerate mutase